LDVDNILPRPSFRRTERITVAADRRYIVAAAFLTAVGSVGEPARAATSPDRDRVLEAVAVRELKSNPTFYTVRKARFGRWRAKINCCRQ
jgi:hypothetical protein